MIRVHQMMITKGDRSTACTPLQLRRLLVRTNAGFVDMVQARTGGT